MAKINKLKLANFRRFQDFEIVFDDDLNLLIGDNESGKSSILLAIDLVLSGSRNKIESIGLENLFSQQTISSYLETKKRFADLPKLYIELYLDEQNDQFFNGKNNSTGVTSDGLFMICEPDLNMNESIQEILNQPIKNFPFEYYQVNFKTFADNSFNSYNRKFNHLFIDSSQINSEYATQEFIRTIYNSNVSQIEKNRHQNEFRKYKEDFKDKVLEDVNKKFNNYSFAVKTTNKSSLENELTIFENNINIENKGKGKQCFIKTNFAINKNNSVKPIEMVLLEEPENHLSHVNMKKLIKGIEEALASNPKQLFITTHNSLISSRLNLQKAILLSPETTKPLKLNKLDENTAKFFMKAPDNNVLEYIMSKKVILVEGDAEFILMEKFFVKITGKFPEEENVHIISVNGTSFKRYIEIANELKIKTAVLRDNDGDYQKYCVTSFEGYTSDDCKVFFETDNTLRTFEIAMYQSNKDIYDATFKDKRKTLSVQDYILSNKAESAFIFLELAGEEFTIPKYIQDAIQWIKN